MSFSTTELREGVKCQRGYQNKLSQELEAACGRGRVGAPSGAGWGVGRTGGWAAASGPPQRLVAAVALEAVLFTAGDHV